MRHHGFTVVRNLEGTCYALRSVFAQRLHGRSRGIEKPGHPAMKTLSTWRLLGAICATLLGVAFFFTIIGVFGLPASIFALALFIALVVAISRRPQIERKQP